MGLNFEVACHRHRVKRYILRGHEHLGLHTFYSDHERCLRDGGWEAVRIYPSGWTGEPEGWEAERLEGYAEECYPPETVDE